MPMPSPSNEWLSVVARVLLRCWLLGFALLMLWLGIVVFAGDALYRLHGPMFGISKHEMDVILYCCLALCKILVILFFFFPWLAIRLAPRRETPTK